MTLKNGIFTVIVLFLPHLWSKPLFASESPLIKHFEIRPAVCIVEKDSHCISRFLFNWELAYATQVCLKPRADDQALVCDHSEKFTVELDIDITRDSYFDLIPQEQTNQTVSRRIDVQVLNKDVRILHRRIWSVF